MCEKQKHWQKQKETILILIVVNARNRKTNLNKAPQCVKCNKTLYVYRKAKP